MQDNNTLVPAPGVHGAEGTHGTRDTHEAHGAVATPASTPSTPAEPSTTASGGSRRAGGLAALLAMLSMSSVQFGAALSAPAMTAYGSFSTTWLRLCWAAVVLALIVRPPLRSYARSHWLAAGTLGVAMAGMTLCFFAALQRIPLGLAVAIDFLGPLTVATFGVRRLRALVWPVLAIAGVLLLAHDRAGWVGDPLGVLLALGAALGWGSYIVLMKKTGTLFPGLEGLSVSLLAAAVVATPFGLVESGGHIPLAQLGATAGLAVLVPLLPYALEMIALRHMRASSFGILMSIEPAIGALAGFVVLRQPLTLPQLAGMLLVVSASLGVVLAAP
ncbi:EamA family transporter [Paraburkholderia phenazinium]|uniref:Inner membrane transporter RhtA n=1 Tax=Paraburkholderia phenazinium TaxID=60549 RepID=A0A1G8A287_9BURK|nr:EamA family transporter [Paraburkholderia phenazinium]SDH15044.1 inner membrane transporter RhtA [Paraburkholderia phenazinium]